MNQHPLQYFNYCPHCGSSKFRATEIRAKHCDDCGFTYYLNPAAAVAAIITDDKGRILLTRRKFEPAKGTLDLPGGFAELGETLEEALIREIKEELGVELTDVQYFASFPNQYPYSGMTIHTLDTFFTAHVADKSQLTSADDVEAYEWVEKDEIKLEDIGLTSIRKAIKLIIDN